MILGLLLFQSWAFASQHISNDWAIVHPDTEQAIEKALAEHESSTGQTIEIILLREVPNGTPREEANSRLRSKVDPALEHLSPRMSVVVSSTEQTAGASYTTAIDGAIEDKSALESAIDTLEGHLRTNRPNQGVSRLVLQILASLGSPVLEGREIDEVLQEWRIQDADAPAVQAESPSSSHWSGILLLLLGVGATFFFIEVLLGLEVRVSERGTHKVSPVERVLSRILRLRKSPSVESFHGNW